MTKKRLDVLLYEKGIVPSREKAQRLILAGLVYVDNHKSVKPGMSFDDSVCLKVIEKDFYVSKGGQKIKPAYEKFGLEFKNKIIVDVGSSTGGFTDFALKNKAKRVYAIDVGYGQLAQKLRENPKVVVMEKTNIKDINALPEIIDFFLIDVSFISLKKVLSIIKNIILNQKYRSEVIALIKPQFEVGKKMADKFKGVIKDEKVQMGILQDIIEFSKKENFLFKGFQKAGLRGEKGNQEYFIYLEYNRL